jgi:molybdopterin-synthase adenylyltransferase
MNQDLARYHRQMLLPDFGEAAQRRLGSATAFVLGCGALGSLVVDLLARAGVGHLVIADRDFVELTNLQRQLLFDEQDVAEALPKAEAARRRIARINSDVRVTAIIDDVNHRNIAQYADEADVIVDGLDNFETRFLANDLAVMRGIPYIYGGAVGTSGAALAILPHTPRGDAAWETLAGGSRATPCLRCLFEDLPPAGTMPTCDTAGVLGSVVTMIASFEATEALKVLSGNLERVNSRLLNVDAWANAIDQLAVASAYERGDCRCCRHRDFEFLDGRRGSGATALCGRNAVQLSYGQTGAPADLPALAARLDAHASVKVNAYMLRAALTDNGQRYELTIFADGRAIVHGTGEPGVARSVYAKYVGA